MLQGCSNIERIHKKQIITLCTLKTVVYLKEYKESEYTALIISGKLHKHLHDVDVKAQKILDCFIKDAKKTAPDKATHQMEWVGHMNSARNSAEEVINHRLIYV